MSGRNQQNYYATVFPALSIVFEKLLFFFRFRAMMEKKGEENMERTERVELTVLCLIEQNGRYLLQDRVKEDWKGCTLPGGHVEPGESIVDAAVREMREETGLTIEDPKLCGVKQFPISGGRYLVFLFRAARFHGEIRSSQEGQMHWVKREELSKVNLVSDFDDLLRVMLDENLSEFQYVVDGEDWNVVLK